MPISELEPALEVTPALERSGYPVISIDRTLRHFISGIDIDTESIASFYDNLPHENKRPLAELPIHLSAAQVVDNSIHSTLVGELMWRGTKSRGSVPIPERGEVTRPLIVVYVGSVLLDHDNDQDVSDQVSNTVRHELTHYAQGREFPEINRFQRIKHRTISYAETVLLGLIVDRQWLKTGAASFAAGEILSEGGDTQGALKLALAAGAIRHTAGWKRRRREDKERQHVRDITDEREIEAQHHGDNSNHEAQHGEDSSSHMVTIHLAQFTQEMLDKTEYDKARNPLARWAANQLHKQLALEPVNS